MDYTSTYARHPNKCLVITSSLSLNCNTYLPLSLGPGSALLYACFDEKSVIDVPAVDSYEIILDLGNSEIEKITSNLFNKLLSSTSCINVVATNCSSKWNLVTASALASLKKLRDCNLIKLKILDGTEAEQTNFTIDPIENVTCFIGPGNTGKTSILSSISEIFAKNEQSIAIIDLTQTHKLSSYFSDSTNVSTVLNSFTECGQLDIYHNYMQCNEFVSLYTFDNMPGMPHAAPVLLHKFIEYLSKVYSRVVINADSEALDEFQSIFNCINKMFIVYDLTPTKIDLSHQLLLKLNSLGLTGKQDTSIIYNKFEKGTEDIQYFEENVIFDKSASGKLIPLIDIHCNTLEILYSKQTMYALFGKFKNQEQVLGTAPKNYVKNIIRIYNLINNNLYHESNNMQLNEFVFSCVDKVRNFLYFNLFKRAARIFSRRKSGMLNNSTHTA